MAVADIQNIGPYQIIRPIGKGGMGSVYEAVNRQIERRVAIKVLHSQFAENPQVVQRFLNEARAVNIVKHRCLVDIYEFGQLPDGAAYIVMEYLDGDTLHERLWREGGKLTMEAAIRTGRQIGLALAAAHSKGIIHRDLKPANIMFVEDPETGHHDYVKVLDFGLARVREPTEESERLTQSGVIMGTPVYMSPEQIRSARSVTDRSDVYALGVILFEMLAGQKPFASNSDAEVMFMHLSVEPPSLRSANSTLPALLCDLVDSMLRKLDSQRPTAAEVAQTLGRLTGSPSTSMPVVNSSRSDRYTPVPLEAAETKHLLPQLPDARSTIGATATQKASRPGMSGSTWPRLALGAGLLLAVAGGSVAALLRAGYGGEVRWSIQSVPPGADILAEGGQLVGHTPFHGQRPRAVKSQTLTLHLSGFADAQLTCEGRSDCNKAATLVALPPPAPATETPPPSEPPAKEEPRRRRPPRHLKHDE